MDSRRYDPLRFGREASAANIINARDSSCPIRWELLSELLYGLSDEEFKIVQGLADGSLGKDDVEDANNYVKVIRDLLNDKDRDIRDVTKTHIRLTPRPHRGRRLKPEDFPEIYAEYKKE